jgi:hypothetical protein
LFSIDTEKIEDSSDEEDDSHVLSGDDSEDTTDTASPPSETLRRLPPTDVHEPSPGGTARTGIPEAETNSIASSSSAPISIPAAREEENTFLTSALQPPSIKRRQAPSAAAREVVDLTTKEDEATQLQESGSPSSRSLGGEDDEPADPESPQQTSAVSDHPPALNPAPPQETDVPGPLSSNPEPQTPPAAPEATAEDLFATAPPIFERVEYADLKVQLLFIKTAINTHSALLRGIEQKLDLLLAQADSSSHASALAPSTKKRRRR